MWVLFFIQCMMIAMFAGLGWALRKKEAYWLLSGFANRPKEEQEKLIQNEYPQKVGALLLYTALGMLVLLPLLFTDFPYRMEVQFGFMLLFLLGGLIYLSKYEIPKKRKKAYILSSSIFIVTIGFVTVLLFLSYQDHDLVLGEKSFEITGMYGDTWVYEDIEKIELFKEMPEVTWKQNGSSLPTIAKGYFKVTGYDSSLLFIHKETTPIIYIKIKDEDVFINGTTREETLDWHQELVEKASP